MPGPLRDKDTSVRLFASGDGIHNFTNGQKASGVPNAEKEFSELIRSGLKVELCGTCLNFRSIKDGDISAGAERSTMKNLFTMVKETDVCVTLWGQEVRNVDAVCLVIRKAPYGKIHAAEAVRHVNGALASGLETRVILVGDGVYLARGNHKAAEAGWTSLSGTLSQVPRAEGGENVHFYVHSTPTMRSATDPMA